MGDRVKEMVGVGEERKDTEDTKVVEEEVEGHEERVPEGDTEEEAD